MLPSLEQIPELIDSEAGLSNDAGQRPRRNDLSTMMSDSHPAGPGRMAVLSMASVSARNVPAIFQNRSFGLSRRNSRQLRHPLVSLAGRPFGDSLSAV